MAIYGLLALLGIYVFTRRKYTIYNNGKKYLTRTYLFGKWFRRLFDRNLFIHHFHASDSREYHSHRWLFGYSLILWGGYREYKRKLVDNTALSEWQLLPVIKYFVVREQKYGPLSVNRLDSEWFHRTDMLNEKQGTYSLFYAGPFATTDWGFSKDDGTVEYAKDRFKGNREDLSDD